MIVPFAVGRDYESVPEVDDRIDFGRPRLNESLAAHPHGFRDELVAVEPLAVPILGGWARSACRRVAGQQTETENGEDTPAQQHETSLSPNHEARDQSIDGSVERTTIGGEVGTKSFGTLQQDQAVCVCPQRQRDLVRVVVAQIACGDRRSDAIRQQREGRGPPRRKVVREPPGVRARSMNMTAKT